ncbi:helix-turn-helix domain-containing protein [Mesorhizobium sp. SP-1A]|uniref:helix-turn-helix domain-containing protein n=1 Tax=Mesorhizobium sp. SP-1A TaxID=3077840 RepID=UPI0028F6D3BB|nr:cupin domain-containing protein [Mesorhizobium sp. SP-1A]
MPRKKTTTAEKDATPPPEGPTPIADVMAIVGAKIRELRTARNMKLQDLAQETDVSTSMLSLLERGLTAPSIGTLISIASALNATMAELVPVGHGASEKVVLRKADSAAVEAKHHVRTRLLKEDPARGVYVTINEYEPDTGSSGRQMLHAGIEFGYILEGELTVDLDGTSYLASPGDFISFQSRRPHRFWNHGKRITRAIWFNMYATGRPSTRNATDPLTGEDQGS